MSDIVIFRPGGGAAARTLAVWGRRAAVRVANSAVHSLTADYYGSTATAANVASSLLSCRAAFFFCHGVPDKLLARGAALLDAGNAAHARDRVVVAVGCSSALKLGPTVVAAGAESYLGFDDKLVWLAGDPHGKFEDAAVAAVDCLLGGGDAAGSQAALDSGYDRAFNFYRSSPVNVSSSDRVIGWLAASWNRAHVRLHGNSRAAL